jgi:multidrug efflux pump
MMSSKLLKPDLHPAWLPRHIDSGFEAFKRIYGSVLDTTLRSRPPVYIIWGVLTLLIVPLYMLSPKELAPNEDQGVVFGAIDVPANATLEQLTPYTEEVARIFKSIPEFEQSFQITFPQTGFGGLLVKPWERRNRNIFQIQGEVAAKLSAVAGIRAPAFLPSALPSAGFFPVEFVVESTANHEEVLRFAQLIVHSPRGRQEWAVCVPPHYGRTHRPRQDRDRSRPRQGGVDGCQHA